MGVSDDDGPAPGLAGDDVGLARVHVLRLVEHDQVVRAQVRAEQLVRLQHVLETVGNQVAVLEPSGVFQEAHPGPHLLRAVPHPLHLGARDLRASAVLVGLGRHYHRDPDVPFAERGVRRQAELVDRVVHVDAVAVRQLRVWERGCPAIRPRGRRRGERVVCCNAVAAAHVHFGAEQV